MANRTPQYIGAGSNRGPGPKKDWLEADRGLQKLMKNPFITANSIVISNAHSADAKVFVTPLIPLPLICLIQLIPTKQLLIVITAPTSLTNLLCRYPFEQQSLIRFQIVAQDAFLKRMDLKVKVEQQLLQITGSRATQVVLAFQVIPGPFTQSPEYLLRMVVMSDQKLVTVQVLLQVWSIRSPSSRSQRLMESEQKMFMQALKLLKQALVVKLLFSISQPRSIAQKKVFSLIYFFMAVDVPFRMRSLMQVTADPQIEEVQLYLYPNPTCMLWQKRWFQFPLNLEAFTLVRKMGLVRQSSTSGKYMEMPIILEFGEARTSTFFVKSTEDRIWVYCMVVREIVKRRIIRKVGERIFI